MRKTEIQALTFDAAGTLIHLAEPVGISYAKVAQDYGITADSDALNLAFRAVWKRTPPAFSEGWNEATHPMEKDWWRHVVSEVFTEANNWSQLPEDFDHFFDALYLYFESPGTWLADEHAHEVLRIVSATYPCAILSNFDSRLRTILSDLELLHFFDPVILSCEVRSSKPDGHIFACAAKQLGLPPAAILHIGDDPDCDAAGARAAGFQHFACGKSGRSIKELIELVSK